MAFRLDSELPAYLEATEEIDFEHSSIDQLISERGWLSLDQTERARCAFEFVRDEIAHSADVKSRVVTRKASEVLEHGVGICYAKSHLLAALLRRMGIPTGLCYQRLTLFDDATGGYAVHSFNGLYLEDADRWIRVDARGNKPGVDAQFRLDEERLAFPVRDEMDEVDYGVIHARPAPETLTPLVECTDAEEMYLHRLPSRIGSHPGSQ